MQRPRIADPSYLQRRSLTRQEAGFSPPSWGRVLSPQGAEFPVNPSALNRSGDIPSFEGGFPDYVQVPAASQGEVSNPKAFLRGSAQAGRAWTPRTASVVVPVADLPPHLLNGPSEGPVQREPHRFNGRFFSTEANPAPTTDAAPPRGASPYPANPSQGGYPYYIDQGEVLPHGPAFQGEPHAPFPPEPYPSESYRQDAVPNYPERVAYANLREEEAAANAGRFSNLIGSITSHLNPAELFERVKQHPYATAAITIPTGLYAGSVLFSGNNNDDGQGLAAPISGVDSSTGLGTIDGKIKSRTIARLKENIALNNIYIDALNRTSENSNAA